MIVGGAIMQWHTKVRPAPEAGATELQLDALATARRHRSIALLRSLENENAKLRGLVNDLLRETTALRESIER
jgi:hypothetical protein